MPHLFQPGSSNTSFTTRCFMPWCRRRWTSTDVEEFTPLNSIAGKVNSTAITGQDDGKTKISTASYVRRHGYITTDLNSIPRILTHRFRRFYLRNLCDLQLLRTFVSARLFSQISCWLDHRRRGVGRTRRLL